MLQFADLPTDLFLSLVLSQKHRALFEINKAYHAILWAQGTKSYLLANPALISASYREHIAQNLDLKKWLQNLHKIIPTDTDHDSLIASAEKLTSAQDKKIFLCLFLNDILKTTQETWLKGQNIFPGFYSLYTNCHPSQTSVDSTPKKDIKFYYLHGARDFSGTDLRNANLCNINLTDSSLTGAVLSHANLINARLTRSNLTGADLSHANLTSADLTHSSLTGADLSHANLTSTKLTCVNLRSANLTNTTIVGAILDTNSFLAFYNAGIRNFNKITFIGIDLIGANLTGITIVGATLNHNSLLAFYNAQIRDFREVNLHFLTFSGNLSHLNLAGANLTGANLTGANLTGTNLTDANLTRVTIVAAKLDRGSFLAFYKAGIRNFSQVDLSGVDLTGVNLTDANLTGANLTGANLNNTDLTNVTLKDSIIQNTRFFNATGLFKAFAGNHTLKNFITFVPFLLTQDSQKMNENQKLAALLTKDYLKNNQRSHIFKAPPNQEHIITITILCKKLCTSNDPLCTHLNEAFSSKKLNPEGILYQIFSFANLCILDNPVDLDQLIERSLELPLPNQSATSSRIH